MKTQYVGLISDLSARFSSKNVKSAVKLPLKINVDGEILKYICIGVIALSVLAVGIISICAAIKRKKRLHNKGSNGIPGLKNKKTIKKSYENAINRLGAYNCLVYIGSDFKRIVEQSGLRSAENMLKDEANILLNSCQDYDAVSMASDGEFLLSIQCRDGLHAEQRVAELTKKLNRHQQQTDIGNIAPYTAGICLPEATPLTFESALTKARIAYDYARDNCLPYYTCTADLVRNEVSRKRLRDHLNEAIDAGQFEMFLQFLYDVDKKTFTGAEALSRWNNPEEGFVMPGAYINDMRTTGVMERFDYYMLKKVCRQLSEWKDTEFGGISISCNITRITISSAEFSKNFRDILSEYKFDRSKLILELTEDALIDSQTVARKNLLECKNVGCRVAIDDFGAGNTSISDLSDYPVDIIKVDRLMVTKTTGSERGSLLLRGLVDLAHQLNMTVVCEGVETKRQSEIVIRNNCDLIQGYFYSYVMPIHEAQAFYLNAEGKIR